ncbi:MAG TPA: inorganic phosphate transporter [Terracidiphilus sp.]|nr:inorganic phosphate transporter [Terracidiphilus sp.]
MAGTATITRAFPERSTFIERKMRRPRSRFGKLLFVLAMAAGVSYIAVEITRDMEGVPARGLWPFLVLGLALLIALGFEFVNGFHDTANAVATVIYTHSLEPDVAVVWSGLCNLAGVLASTGTVAFAVVMLLPVELILKVSSGGGYAMVFALLIAAILWNLGTWWFGLPASSSHTMVGSIIGVGVANQLLNWRSGASGVDWTQALKVLEVLLVSPLIGFACAGLLIWLSKRLVRVPSLYEAPKSDDPPPWPIRMLLVLTCTGVSFCHGSNDGQKGMGLIVLILIGTFPTAYALNHGLSTMEVQAFIAASQQAGSALNAHVAPGTMIKTAAGAEAVRYIRSGQMRPETAIAVRNLVDEVGSELSAYKSFQAVPAQDQTRLRNDMYVAGEALHRMTKSHQPAFTAQEVEALKNYERLLDRSTKFIPDWVKVAVALALGLGTMVGWKRVVVTIGERIGKEHLTYAQGASAQLVAMGTIFAADAWGLPVSTTHILSSGVAGTMAANGNGLHLSTVRNIAAGWVLTLPAAALLSGLLYCLFRCFTAYSG